MARLTSLQTTAWYRAGGTVHATPVTILARRGQLQVRFDAEGFRDFPENVRTEGELVIAFEARTDLRQYAPWRTYTIPLGAWNNAQQMLPRRRGRARGAA